MCRHGSPWPKRVTHLCTHLYVFINPNIRIFFVKTCFLNSVFNCHISLDSREPQNVSGRRSDALPGCSYITIYTTAFHLSDEVYMHKERKKRGASERIIVLVSPNAHNLSCLCSFAPRTTGYRSILNLS